MNYNELKKYIKFDVEHLDATDEVAITARLTIGARQTLPLSDLKDKDKKALSEIRDKLVKLIHRELLKLEV